MHYPHGVAIVQHCHNLPANHRRRSLAIVPLGYDPIEQLPAGAVLHDQVHRVPVLIHALELHHVGVPGQVVDHLHLAPEAVGVVGGEKAADCHGLAGAELAGAAVGAEVGDAELAAADLVADGVCLAEVAHGAAKDDAGAGEGLAAGKRRGVGFGPDFEGRGGIRRAPAVAGRRRGAAVAHRRRGGEFEFGSCFLERRTWRREDSSRRRRVDVFYKMSKIPLY